MINGITQAVGIVGLVIFTFSALAKGGAIIRLDFNKLGGIGHEMIEGVVDGADEVETSPVEFHFDPSRNTTPR